MDWVVLLLVGVMRGNKGAAVGIHRNGRGMGTKSSLTYFVLEIVMFCFVVDRFVLFVPSSSMEPKLLY